MADNPNPLDGFMQTIGETQAETNDRVYAEGVKDGQDANWSEKIAHRLGGEPSNVYEKGFEYGINNPASEDDDDD